MTQPQSAAERLTALNTKERQLAETLIRLNTERENLEREQKALSAEAIERFGTDDLEALRARFRKADKENTERLDAYEKALVSLEQQLTALKSAGV